VEQVRLRLSCCLQSGRHLEEPLLERRRDRLEAVHCDAGLDEPAIDVGAGCLAIDVGVKGQADSVGERLGGANGRVTGDDAESPFRLAGADDNAARAARRDRVDRPLRDDATEGSVGPVNGAG
jgi:hypothetical protein